MDAQSFSEIFKVLCGFSIEDFVKMGLRIKEASNEELFQYADNLKDEIYENMVPDPITTTKIMMLHKEFEDRGLGSEFIAKWYEVRENKE